MKYSPLFFSFALFVFNACASTPKTRNHEGTETHVESKESSTHEAHKIPHKTHWSYIGQEGPEFWSGLSPQNIACATGSNQSPVDLRALTEADLSPLLFSYTPVGHEIINNGHTVQVNFQDGSTFSVDGHEYALKQFHFHSPSENVIEGKSFPLEAHLVHADDQGNLAVISLMFEEGKENMLLKKLGEIPQDKDQKNALKDSISAEELLPTDHDYYRFNGSLTTPPCTEGVLWLVMKNSLSVSKTQIEAMTKAMHSPNNRPLQPIHSRTILK